VSWLDALVATLGIDITTRGLQIFDARHLVGMRHELNPAVPTVIMGVDAFVDTNLLPNGSDVDALFDALAIHIRKFFAGDPLLTLVFPGRASAPVSVPLDRIAELTGAIRPGSALFIDKQTTPNL
jgi:hypothetical protein